MQPAVKDEEAAHPVASDWRPAFREIVASFSRGDFALTGLTSVNPVDLTTQNQIKMYLADYGETLDALPEETWTTSVAQWMGSARVFEDNPGDYRIEVDSVHVP